MVEKLSRRAEVKSELLALIDMHIAAFDNYTVIVNDAANNHYARRTTEQN